MGKPGESAAFDSCARTAMGIDHIERPGRLTKAGGFEYGFKYCRAEYKDDVLKVGKCLKAAGKGLECSLGLGNKPDDRLCQAVLAKKPKTWEVIKLYACAGGKTGDDLGAGAEGAVEDSVVDESLTD